MEQNYIDRFRRVMHSWKAVLSLPIWKYFRGEQQERLEEIAFSFFESIESPLFVKLNILLRVESDR